MSYQRYRDAAEQYRPKRIKILLIQESPPYAQDRHFYFTGIRMHDMLWVALTRFLYEKDFGDAAAERARKDVWLKRFCGDGYFTIDAVQQSIAKEGPDARATLITARAPAAIAEVRALAPAQIVLVKKSVFEGFAEPFRAAGLPVVNDVAVPFPGRGQEGRFRAILGDLVSSGKLKL